MSILDSAFSVAGRLGRYFSVVTLLPTTMLVLYVYVLLRAGGGTTTFNPAFGLHAVITTSLSGYVWLAVGSVLLSLLLHPLQFSLTQLFEGYWGPTRLGLALTTSRVLAHRRHAVQLETMGRKACRDWVGQDKRQAAIERLSTTEATTKQIRAYLASEAATKARSAYPHDLRRILPTRLGNILRRSEDSVGRQYGLRVLAVFPHLTHVAQPSRSQAAFQEQEQMDLALRLCLSAGAATVITLVLLAPTGLWVFLAVATYLVAYIAYRATCSAAEAWMYAVGVMLDLDRFAVYDALHIPLPEDSRSERQSTGPGVCDMLEGKPTVPTQYELPPPSSTDANT